MIHWLIRWLDGPFRFALRAAGMMLRWVRINHVKRIVTPGPAESITTDPRATIWICKQRTWYCHLPILIGNLVLRYREAPLRVLPTTQWLAWEQVIACLRREENAGDRLPQPSGTFCRGLLTPAWPGEPLSHLLQQRDLADSRKSDFIIAAAESLAQLHQIRVNESGQSEILLSHGDASVANVICQQGVRGQRFRNLPAPSQQHPCQTNPVAVWFDFDLRHDLQVDPVVRQSDDLRAFLFTMAWVYACPDLMSLLGNIQRVYSNLVIWRHFKGQLQRSAFQADLFHWAQIYRLEKIRFEKIKPLQGGLFGWENAHSSMTESTQRLSDGILKMDL